MTRRRFLLLVAAGLCATTGAVVIAVVGAGQVPLGTGPGTDPGWIAWLVALGGLGVAVWVLWDRTDGSAADESASRPGQDPICERTPEATPRRQPLTGGELVEAITDAGEVAREDRDVEAGVAVVRPLLRAAYEEIRDRDRSDAEPETALDAGTWTDDPVAAAALSAEVTPPARSLRQRLRDWLYPGRAVRRRVGRAVDALAAVADDAVPPVVGQSAPRQVPVHEPSLAARTVGADGEYPTTSDGGAHPDGSDGEGESTESEVSPS